MSRATAAAALLALATLARAPTAEADEEAPQRPASARRVGVKVEGGATYRRIFTLPVAGGEGALGIGSLPATSRPGVPDVFVRARYGFGRTENGLAVHVARAGAQIEFPIGRFRPWIAADAMWLGIARVTEPSLVQHWGLGAGLGASFDVVRTTERGAIYLGLGGELDLFPHKLVPRTLSPVASLTLGARF